jgi:BlaR1 peptidase M56
LVACALHWFNPLVWFAAWRLDVERERSCDDLVLASGVRPSAYAGHLLDVVTGLSPARWTQACGLAMARKSSLEGRLTAVLGKDLNRRRVSMSLAGLALVIAVGIAVPIAMLRAAQYAETNSDDKSMNAEPMDDKSKALPGAGPKNINVSATDRLGRRTRMIFHLAPDEYAEVKGHSIAWQVVCCGGLLPRYKSW